MCLKRFAVNFKTVDASTLFAAITESSTLHLIQLPLQSNVIAKALKVAMQQELGSTPPV